MGVLLWAASVALWADQTLSLFDGTTDAVNLAPWGSGDLKLSDQEKFGEQQALEVTTDGYYVGGRLDLKTPVAFGPFVTDPIQTQVIIIAKAEAPQPTGGYTGYGPGAAGAYPPGAFPPGAFPPGGMPGGMPGGPGMGWGTGATYQPPQPIDKIRVALVTNKGELSSGDLLLDPNVAVDGDWLRLSAVLSNFRKPADLAGATLERVVISGNRKGKIYVAQVQIVQEDTPLVAEIEGPKIRTAGAGPPTSFQAKPVAPGVNASHEWDFDNLNGLGVDAYGPAVTYQFAEPGYYVVTLRVSDQNGKLKPRLDTVRVVVE